MQNPFRYFNSSPGIIRLAVMMYVRFPLSLRQVEDLLSERVASTSATRRYGSGGTGSVRNHFNHDRRLSRRDIFKQHRFAALAEWRQLAA